MTDVIYRNKKTYEKFVLKICKEQLMTVNIVMFFPKNSYLRDTFNIKLNELLTAGIVQFWVQNFIDIRFLNAKTKSDEPRTLTLEKLSGVFKIWMIGIGASILIFLLEILNVKLKPHLKKFLHQSTLENLLKI
jgi:hypothetical protein